MAEVRGRSTSLRYYADEAERVCAPITLPGPTGESNASSARSRRLALHRSVEFPAGNLHGPGRSGAGDRQHRRCQACRADTGGGWKRLSCRTSGIPTDVLQTVTGLTNGRRDPGRARPSRRASCSLAQLRSPRSSSAQPRREGRPNRSADCRDGWHQCDAGDSTALPEHVADAVVQSAFRSADQRCSALRLLCVHEEIADHVVTMLRAP